MGISSTWRAYVARILLSYVIIVALISTANWGQLRLLAVGAAPANPSEPRQINPVSVLLPATIERGVELKLKAYGGCYRWRSQRGGTIGLRGLTHEEWVELHDGEKEKAGAVRDDAVSLKSGATPTATPGNLYSSWPNADDIKKGHECGDAVVIGQNQDLRSTMKAETLLSHPTCKTWVFAEDVKTQTTLRCEVHVSPIDRIVIETTVKHLNVGGVETLQVRAFDQDGNSFSSLEGLRFQWKIKDENVVKSASLSHDVYRPSAARRKMQEKGEQSDVLLLRGISSGRTTIQVKLMEKGYESVEPATVWLDVQEPIAVIPGELKVLPMSRVDFGLKLLRPKDTCDSSMTSCDDAMVKLPSPTFNWTLGTLGRRADGAAAVTNQNEYAKLNDKTGTLDILALNPTAEKLTVTVTDQRTTNNTDSAVVSIVNLGSLKLSNAEVSQVIEKLVEPKERSAILTTPLSVGVSKSTSPLTNKQLMALEQIHLNQYMSNPKVYGKGSQSVLIKDAFQTSPTGGTWHWAKGVSYVVNVEALTSALEQIYTASNINFDIELLNEGKKPANDTADTSTVSPTEPEVLKIQWMAKGKSWGVLRAVNLGKSKLQVRLTGIEGKNGQTWTPERAVAIEQNIEVVPAVSLVGYPEMRAGTGGVVSPVPIVMPRDSQAQFELQGGSGSYFVESDNPRACRASIVRDEKQRMNLLVETGKSTDVCLLSIRDQETPSNGYNIHCMVAEAEAVYLDPKHTQLPLEIDDGSHADRRVPLRAIAKIPVSVHTPNGRQVSSWLPLDPMQWTADDKVVAREFGYFMHFVTCPMHPSDSSKWLYETSRPDIATAQGSVSQGSSMGIVDHFVCDWVQLQPQGLPGIFKLRALVIRGEGQQQIVSKESPKMTPAVIAEASLEFYQPLRLYVDGASEFEQIARSQRSPQLFFGNQSAPTVTSSRIESAISMAVGTSVGVTVSGGPSAWPGFALKGRLHVSPDDSLAAIGVGVPTEILDKGSSHSGALKKAYPNTAVVALSNQRGSSIKSSESIGTSGISIIDVQCLAVQPVVTLQYSVQNMPIGSSAVKGGDDSSIIVVGQLRRASSPSSDRSITGLFSSDHPLARVSGSPGLLAKSTLHLGCAVPRALGIMPDLTHQMGMFNFAEFAPPTTYLTNKHLVSGQISDNPKLALQSHSDKSLTVPEKSMYAKCGMADHKFKLIGWDEYGRPMITLGSFNPTWGASPIETATLFVETRQLTPVLRLDASTSTSCVGQTSISATLTWSGSFDKSVFKYLGNRKAESILSKTASEVTRILTADLDVLSHQSSSSPIASNWKSLSSPSKMPIFLGVALDVGIAPPIRLLPHGDWLGSHQVSLVPHKDLAYGFLIQYGSGRYRHSIVAVSQQQQQQSSNGTSIPGNTNSVLPRIVGTHRDMNAIDIPVSVSSGSTLREMTIAESLGVHSVIRLHTSNVEVLRSHPIEGIVQASKFQPYTPSNPQNMEQVFVQAAGEGLFRLIVEDPNMLGSESVYLDLDIGQIDSIQVELLEVPVAIADTEMKGNDLTDFKVQTAPHELVLMSTSGGVSAGDIPSENIYGIRVVPLLADGNPVNPVITEGLKIRLQSGDEKVLTTYITEEDCLLHTATTSTSKCDAISQIMSLRRSAVSPFSGRVESLALPNFFVEGRRAGTTTIIAALEKYDNPNAQIFSSIKSTPLHCSVHDRLTVWPPQLVMLPGGHTTELVVNSGRPTTSQLMTAYSLNSTNENVVKRSSSFDMGYVIESSDIGSAVIKIGSTKSKSLGERSKLGDRWLSRRSLEATTISTRGAFLKGRDDTARVSVSVAHPAKVVINTGFPSHHDNQPFSLETSRAIRLRAGLLTSDGQRFYQPLLHMPSGFVKGDGRYFAFNPALDVCDFTWKSTRPEVISLIMDTNTHGGGSLQGKLDGTHSTRMRSDQSKGPSVTAISLSPGSCEIQLHVQCYKMDANRFWQSRGRTRHKPYFTKSSSVSATVVSGGGLNPETLIPGLSGDVRIEGDVMRLTNAMNEDDEVKCAYARVPPQYGSSGSSGVATRGHGGLSSREAFVSSSLYDCDGVAAVVGSFKNYNIGESVRLLSSGMESSRLHYEYNIAINPSVSSVILECGALKPALNIEMIRKTASTFSANEEDPSFLVSKEGDISTAICPQLSESAIQSLTWNANTNMITLVTNPDRGNVASLRLIGDKPEQTMLIPFVSVTPHNLQISSHHLNQIKAGESKIFSFVLRDADGRTILIPSDLNWEATSSHTSLLSAVRLANDFTSGNFVVSSSSRQFGCATISVESGELSDSILVCSVPPSDYKPPSPPPPQLTEEQIARMGEPAIKKLGRELMKFEVIQILLSHDVWAEGMRNIPLVLGLSSFAAAALVALFTLKRSSNWGASTRASSTTSSFIAGGGGGTTVARLLGDAYFSSPGGGGGAATRRPPSLLSVPDTSSIRHRQTQQLPSTATTPSLMMPSAAAHTPINHRGEHYSQAPGVTPRRSSTSMMGGLPPTRSNTSRLMFGFNETET